MSMTTSYKSSVHVVKASVEFFAYDIVAVVLHWHYREYKRDGLNVICRIANHHPEILYSPAELHMVNEAVMLEVLFLC